jgi:hypothetical protein
MPRHCNKIVVWNLERVGEGIAINIVVAGRCQAFQHRVERKKMHKDRVLAMLDIPYRVLNWRTGPRQL